MQKIKPFITILLVIFIFLICHSILLKGLANLSTYFREGGLDELTVQSYEAKIEVLEKKISEYERAHESLKIYDNPSYILSKIALRDIYHFYDYLVISTSNKVNEGDAVINEQGLVGTIMSANKTTAKVKLLTGKPHISIKVGDAYGMLDDYEKKDGLLVIHNINNYKNVSVGDEVLTSGLQEIEGDLKVGSVERIEKEGVEQVLYVKPYVDFNTLNYLMVVSK